MLRSDNPSLVIPVNILLMHVDSSWIGIVPKGPLPYYRNVRIHHHVYHVDYAQRLGALDHLNCHVNTRTVATIRFWC